MENKKPDWTNEQKIALDDPSQDILVSAAAGSGKTAVLTERLIRKITSTKAPIDVNRILVVTFTEDAANELKVRIRDAVTSKMAEYPDSKHLKRQYLLLPSAKISTIHGFCLDLIKSNYEMLGLTPKLRVADDGQNSLMMQQVADTVIDGYYSSLPEYSDIENFVEFADNFITVQDSSLSDAMIDIYKKLQSYPEGVDFLIKSEAEYDAAIEDISNTSWCKTLFSHIKNTLNYHQRILEDACVEVSKYTDISGVYLPSFDQAIEVIKEVLNELETGSYDAVCEKINRLTVKSMSHKKNYDDDDTLKYCKKLRSDFNTAFKDIKKKYFSYSQEAIRATAEKSKDYISKLHRLLKAFDRRFSFEKRKRGIIDFNDMERMAYSLLVSPDGSYTALADEVGQRFDEVCIDEYQDVNYLQDGIFKSITRSTNRFMVGDIKQSIYGFRGAEPRIFADYRQDDTVTLIPLTSNFRSDEPVIDFSNEICGNLFTKLGKTVPYDDSDKLNFANGSKEYDYPEIVIIEDEKSIEKEEEQYSDEDDDTDEDIGVNAEALYVAKRIKELICSGVLPSDIAILLKSVKGEAKKYEEALASYGIPSKSKEQKDLFGNPEVMLLMCILNVIDNPSRDIYLAGALKSPIYNFTVSELAEIRGHSPKASLYEALVKYTSEFSFKKGELFLSKLEEYRKMAKKPVDRLIWHIFCDSGLLAYASENKLSSKGGKANLMHFYEKARAFEGGTFKGLYNFIRYINDIINSDKLITSPATAEDNGVVQIMTIHKSKGLQFKYVFICGTAKRFNTSDENADIIIDKNIGTSLKLSDDSGLATVDTVYRKISSLEIAKKSFEEEIRVLYVALTRAKSKLVIVATEKNSEKLKELNDLKKYTSISDGYIYTQHRNFISWILLSQDSIIPTFIKAADVFADVTSKSTLAKEVIILDEDKVKMLTEEFASRFSFEYPSDDAAKIPAKLSVSELYPTILDDYDDSEKMADKKKPRMRVPRFIDENESRGAKIGTATHQFMQFCDFDLLEKNGIDAEIERLTTLGFLSPAVSSIVNKNAVSRFIQSDLFSALKGAKSVNRELRFNVHLNASSFTENNNDAIKNETVLVQGVIDCIYETSDGKTVLLDYKTDYVPKDMTEYDAENMLIERHLTQLSYYAAACKKVLSKEVSRVLIYSFALGKTIEIPNDKLIKL